MANEKEHIALRIKFETQTNITASGNIVLNNKSELMFRDDYVDWLEELYISKDLTNKRERITKSIMLRYEFINNGGRINFYTSYDHVTHEGIQYWHIDYIVWLETLLLNREVIKQIFLNDDSK